MPLTPEQAIFVSITARQRALEVSSESEEGFAGLVEQFQDDIIEELQNEQNDSQV